MKYIEHSSRKRLLSENIFNPKIVMFFQLKKIQSTEVFQKC